MIYYNESVMLNESGFDTVDALMECPIYDRYNDMISSISEFGFISESQKIEFKVLEENVFETIGNALKKAWEAIAKFFKGLAEKISGFFKKISLKKIKAAVDKNIEKKDKQLKQAQQEGRLSDPKEVEKLVKKYGINVEELLKGLEKDDKGNYKNYAPLNVDKLIKDTINTNGYKKLKQATEKLVKVVDNIKPDNIKSNEAADKIIKLVNQTAPEIDDSYKTVKIPPKEVKNKINECFDIAKAKSILSTDLKEGYILPKGQKKAADYFFYLSDSNLQNNNKMVKLYNDIANFAKNISEMLDGQKFTKRNFSGYQNKAVNAAMQKEKEILKSFNLDKAGLQQITNATLKAYKNAVEIVLKFGTKEQKDAVDKDDIREINKESYDPWAGLDESYDPWAGLE